MRTIDNSSELLGDDLKASIRSGSKLRIIASTFSIYAFEALKNELESIDELQFVFSSPAFVPEDVTDRLKKQRREFFIPTGHAESSIAGSEFEIRLRNKLTQRAVARECAKWIRKKVKFRSNTSGRQMQSFITVDNDAAYFPIQGFTTPDLGYETSDSFSSFSTKLEGTDETKNLINVFDQTWNSTEQLEDVTAAVTNYIAAVYEENAPAYVYFLILYQVFADYLNEISEDVLPNDRTGYLETKIWNSLYNFQRDAASGIINKLETYNGCILADSVGLGKTYTALAVIKYYELRNKSVLVLCPKKLADNWTTYNSNYSTNVLIDDRFGYDVLAHTDLSREKGQSLGLDLSKLNWGNYDLVVIDESHNFRNADYAEEKESRYQRLMRKVIREGVKTKVLMLSATPVNNRFNDLKNQLQLAYEGKSDSLAAKLELSTSIDKVFADAQRAFNEWSKLDVESRTTDRILKMLDFDFFELLDSVTIARSRRHIQTFYDTTEIGAFPTRRTPISIQEPLTDLKDAPSFNEIFEQLQALTLAVYTPLAYVFPSRISYYEELYDVEIGNARRNLGQAGREQGLKKLMTVNLLKRLESSVEAFRLTVSKIRDAIDSTMGQIDKQSDQIEGSGVDLPNIEFDSSDENDAESLYFGEKISININDIDTVSWRQALWNDRETLDELLEAMETITPEKDRKLQRLKQLIVEKTENPINPGNRKVLIFSAFADTANYLYKELAPALKESGLESAVITGGSHGVHSTLGKGLDFQQAMTLFSPISKKRDEVMKGDERSIDILIGTDVISEGQNLQDCDYLINYDIHWNPVRIIQRFGRIDRLGSRNSTIQLVNFWPDISLDEYINLKDRVENRMVIADIAGTADDNVLTQRRADASFRTEQLRRLQNEVIELEDVRSGISITDLGLNDFRMDLLNYLDKHGDVKRAPKGLHAVIESDPGKGLVPGVIFALRNVQADEKINRGNRLHPYYLLYLDNDGQVVADHTEAKHLLDLLRTGCRPHNEPLPKVAEVFNKFTRDGANMAAYSNLLTDAIHTMIDVTEERDIDSLFSVGGTTALTQEIKGLDDFELIAFIAVVDPVLKELNHG
ncbi:helicase-related protein [Corynebacterium phoceense]